MISSGSRPEWKRALAEQPREHSPVPAAPASEAQAGESGAATPGERVLRRRWPPRVVGGAAVAAVLAIALAVWLFDRLTHVVINDARVVSHMVLISSRVPGWITEIPINEGQHVRKGALLAQVDDREARSRLAEAEAELAIVDARIQGMQAERGMVDDQTARRIDAQRSRLQSARSGLASALAALELARSEYQRALPLRQRNVLSQRDLEERQVNFRRAEQAWHQAESEVAAAQAALLETQAGRGALAMKDDDLRGLLRERERIAAVCARLANVLADHRIRSPMDAVIDDGFVNPGEFVQAGQRMLLLHRVDDLWVRANVKETDIRFIDVGEAVEVTVDALPGQVFAGRVQRIGDSATNMSSLLPNPNPSGNFTKITQRIEVHVTLDALDPAIKPGMMVELKVAK